MSYPGADFDLAWRSALKPDGYTNPTATSAYHLVVVGAGPAGLISAIGAAGLGARVALVERHYMGGDCLNVGCVPSKALLEITQHATHNDKPDFDKAFAWLREVRAGIAPHDSVARYSELGVDVYLGDATFKSKDQLSVIDGAGREQVLRGRRYAICTGARASLPPIPGLIESDPLTNETVFDLTEQPTSLAILGGGAIGCELAQVFARLGTEVHLFELAERLLPLESSHASAALAEAMRDAGVHVHVGTGVKAVRGHGGAGVEVQIDDQWIAAQHILVALGRRPNTDNLGLEAAGVGIDERGLIQVDGKLRTSNRAIYAAGDCASTLQFTHHADAQARAVVQNALFAPTASVAGLVVPHCTYTQPEIASVGASQEQLERDNVEFDTYRVDFDELDRGRAEPHESGFVEVFTGKGTDKILGASIVGPDAGEQLAPLCLLMSNDLGLSAALKTVLAYPTRSEYLKRLADAYNRTRLTPMAKRVLDGWLAFTARRL